MTLRLDMDLMEKVREMARRNRRSLSAEIAMLIEEALAARMREKARRVE